MDAPAPIPPQPKKQGHGCLIALGICGGLFLLLAIVAGVVIWRVSQSDSARAMIGFIGDATQVAAKSMSAPGTDELRKSGCDQAMVMDLSEFASIANRRFARDGGVPAAKVEGKMVACTLAYTTEKAPSCDEVARTYAAAVGPGPHFMAVVQRQGQQKPVCEGEYDGAGQSSAPRGPPAEASSGQK